MMPTLAHRVWPITFLEEPDIELPLVVLLVSGGHTMSACRPRP